MLKTIDVRFFTYAYLEEGADVVEITEECFKDLSGTPLAVIKYEHHTVFENGARQVCLTVDLADWPEVEEVQLLEGVH